ncbi:MAG: methyltransferase [Flavobacteriaceae bacterium]|nr:methyltransferase [Flavobacteriaceae bacterium]|tara:strand:- start:83958 stop:84596 length:639 start_codon:yes stop_codon:yes gene_type:complete
MIFIDEKILEYSIKNSDPPSNLLNDLERETNLKILQPRMLSGNFQGRFLSFLSKISKPKSVIEIGTYTGYSALCIAEGLDPNGVIHTIDNNEELTYIQNKYFEKSNYRSNIKQYTDDAIKILPKLNITFDFAFIDADKINYINYFEIIIKKMKKGGLIVSDNVLWSGKVLEKNSQDEETEMLKKFNSMLKKDKRITNLIVPLRDGLSISQVN